MSRRIARYSATKQHKKKVDLGKEKLCSDFKNDNIPFETGYTMNPMQILDLFKILFDEYSKAPDLNEKIQAVKTELFNRNYLKAFDSSEKRSVYVLRWSSARTLAYSSLFSSIEPLRDLIWKMNDNRKVLCVGGGAASEMVALAALYSRARRAYPEPLASLSLSIVDIASWSDVVKAIEMHVRDHWLERKDNFSASFLEEDILFPKIQIDYYNYDLVTILFTANELFKEKKLETVNFLQELNRKCKSGTYLLIAESAGSFSHLTVGSKQFPVQFLIDMVLIGKPNENNGSWELVEKSDSCWYRVNQSQVQYDIRLENMRFFYRLYKKK